MVQSLGFLTQVMGLIGSLACEGFCAWPQSGIGSSLNFDRPLSDAKLGGWLNPHVITLVEYDFWGRGNARLLSHFVNF
jgi:hypothetical protein